MDLSLQIAIRHLRAPQKGSFSSFAGILAISGLALGITALILTFAILQGFESTISEKIAAFDGHIRLQHFMDQPMIEYDQQVDSLIKAIPYPVKSMSYIQKAALVRKGQRAEGVVVEGIDTQTINQSLATMITAGELDLNPGSIIIGERLANQLGAGLGDRLVLFDLEGMGQLSSTQRLRQYTVRGLFHSGLLEYDQSIVYISLEEAQALFAMENKITGRMLTLADLDLVSFVYQHLEENLNYPYYVLSWKERHRILFEWLTVQKWPILIVFGMIAFVGIVNIISALTMIVLEKVREIGTLISMGFPRSKIKKVFFTEGIIIGCLGSLVGLMVAVILAFVQMKWQIVSIPEDVYFMDNVPIEIHWGMTITIIAIGIAATTLAAVWPTVKASQIEPADALRYE